MEYSNSNIDKYLQLLRPCFQGDFPEKNLEKGIFNELKKKRNPSIFLKLLILRNGGDVSKLILPVEHITLGEKNRGDPLVNFSAKIVAKKESEGRIYLFLFDEESKTTLEIGPQDSKKLEVGEWIQFKNILRSSNPRREFLATENSTFKSFKGEGKEIKEYGDDLRNKDEDSSVDVRDGVVEEVEKKYYKDKRGQEKSFQVIRTFAGGRKLEIIDWNSELLLEPKDLFDGLNFRFEKRGRYNPRLIHRANTFVWVHGKREFDPGVEEISKIYDLKQDENGSKDTLTLKGVFNRYIKTSEKGNLLCSFDDFTETAPTIIPSNLILKSFKIPEKSLKGAENEFFDDKLNLKFFLIQGVFLGDSKEWFYVRKIEGNEE